MPPTWDVSDGCTFRTVCRKDSQMIIRNSATYDGQQDKLAAHIKYFLQHFKLSDYILLFDEINNLPQLLLDKLSGLFPNTRNGHLLLISDNNLNIM
jgi:hypothetical protein